MSKKLKKSTYPLNTQAAEFKCYGPPATKDGQFAGTMICDCGCFNQAGVDSNKGYHACVTEHVPTKKWYAYFEWGRVGAKDPQFQFVECSSKEEAQREYEAQLHSKNTKRGEWVNHPTLGKILQAKAGKDCYLVRPQATRSTGLPDARTIKFNEGTAKPVVKSTSKKSNIDSYTLKLMRDLNVATVSYTRGAMTDDSLPTGEAINEARDILTAALTRLKVVGDNVDDQVKDSELFNLTRFMYGRIPKKKDRNAAAETWILSKNNISSWQQDLDAFEAALATGTDVEVEDDPFSGMPIEMAWLDPKSSVGKFIYNWAPKATRNKHSGIGAMKIKNVWTVERKDEPKAFFNTLTKISKEVSSISDRPFHQVKDRSDISKEERDAFWNTNVAMLYHGTRSVNLSGIMRTGFRFPKELVGVVISGAMFGPLHYQADDWKKSAGYTSLSGGFYSSGAGGVRGRGAFMFICDTILGNPHVAPKSYPYIACPKGTHSIFGKAGVSGVVNNEWIIDNKSQTKLKYLVEFDA